MPRISGWHWLIPLGLALLAIALYANTHGFQLMFSWDDNRYIKENMLLRDGSLQGIINVWTQVYFAAYIPTTIFSYWLEFQRWQMDPAGYHIVNTLLHGLNTGLVYLFLYRILGKRYVALLAAVLFMVHPLQVETVAWVAERKNLLCMLFTMLAFLTHMRSAEDGAPRWIVVATWVLYFLAVFAKPVVVGIPVLFVLYDILWAKKSIRSALVRNAIPLATAAAAAVLIVVAHEGGGGIKEYRGGTFLTGQTLMLRVYWEYLVSFLWPFNLDNFYIYPDSFFRSFDPATAFGALLVIGVSLYSVWSLWRYFVRHEPLRQPFVLFSVLWVLLVLLPTANIVPIAIERADRYMYFPSVVIFALVGLGLEWAWQRWNTPAVRYAIIGAVAVAIAVFTAVTLQRTWVWQNEGELWLDHLEDNPNSQTGWLNLGVYYFNIGSYTEAKPPFQQLLRLSPNHFKGNRFMGHIAVNEGRYADAIPFYQTALLAEPDDAITLNYLAQSYYETGDYEQAVENYRRALSINANFTASYARLGDAALRVGNYELARNAFNEALERDANSALATTGLCTALLQLNQVEDSVPVCQRALALDPNAGQSYLTLGNGALRNGNYELARTALTQALQLEPQSAQANSDLCAALVQLDRVSDSLPYCRQAVELDPENGLFLGRYAHLLILTEQFAEALPVAQRAVQVAPNLALAYRVLGEALAGTGDRDGAVAAFQRTLDIDPTNERATIGLSLLEGTTTTPLASQSDS
jgi:protein O-mannosyl-transferase